jgi:membrane-bound lytic murein transglycosylase B
VRAGNPDKDEVIKAPGLGAFLRRHPKLGPRTAIAAIATGVLLFAVAAVTTAGAAADVAARPAGPATTSAQLLPAAAPPIPLALGTPTPVVKQAVHSAPTHVRHRAPVTHGVISGLAANGIPQVALNAYRVAAARMANVEPGCGIGWWLLAGIGRIESDHGRFGGAVLHADGVSTPKIIGPALDGVHWDYIPAPANGMALDGDAVYAHALGPMQFIPSTWAIYGTDATGDGTADVFNINDAALGAARYLCAAGGDLRSRDGQVRAVLAYNHSDQYLAQVLALADAYRRGIPVSGIPVGITTGPLPRITDTGYIPPANPGAPEAGRPGSSTTGGKTRSTPAGGGKPQHSTAPQRTSSAPKPKPGSSSAPKPSPSPTKSRTSTAPAPGPTSSPTPAPSPTSTCNPLKHLLHLC